MRPPTASIATGADSLFEALAAGTGGRLKVHIKVLLGNAATVPDTHLAMHMYQINHQLFAY